MVESSKLYSPFSEQQYTYTGTMMLSSDIFRCRRGGRLGLLVMKYFFSRCGLYILMKVITLSCNFPEWFTDRRLTVTIVLGLRFSLNL